MKKENLKEVPYLEDMLDVWGEIKKDAINQYCKEKNISEEEFFKKATKEAYNRWDWNCMAYTKAGMELLSDIGIVLNMDCIEQNIFAYHNKISKIKLIYDDKIENKDEYFWKNHLKEQISFCNL